MKYLSITADVSNIGLGNKEIQAHVEYTNLGMNFDNIDEEITRIISDKENG